MLTTMKRVLATLAIIGGLAAAVGGNSTFATFSAQTTNASNTFKAGTVAMTNVAGTAVSGSNCTTETNNGTCATLFTASNMRPGGADLTNSVTISYTGTLQTSDFRIFTSAYTSKTTGSSALCTATDPAASINIQLKAGSTIVFPTSGTGYGTLAAFAAAYSSPTNGLQLKGGTNGSGTAGVWSQNDSALYTINVNLSSVDNTYQGCQSTVSLNWYAAQ